MEPLIEVKNLTIGFGNAEPTIKDVNFSIQKGETLALVGESGSGKTLSCRAILGILPSTAHIHSGEIVSNTGETSQDLLKINEKLFRKVRGDCISMIFQEPMRSLSPLHKVGHQVAEVLELHRSISKKKIKKEVLAQFKRVGFPDPERAYKSYPFEMSGGMLQRAMIAMAMIAKPDLLIADEPTTALDVTTQAQVLGLINDLQKETNMAVILVTHDLGVVANMADKLVVMNKGRIMESGTAKDILSAPAHPYTKKLFDAAPVIPISNVVVPAVPHDDLILDMKNISKTYVSRSSTPWKPATQIKAVRGVDLQLTRGKTLAVVGESGSGKSTCARIALGAELPDEGSHVHFYSESNADPIDVSALTRSERCGFQRQAQMVFQDPYSSLSPRMQIIDTLLEPLRIHKIGTKDERKQRAQDVLNLVGLEPSILRRYPHAFSGGQRQRLSIARALMMEPKLLVCDEPTSALDVSVQDQILDLLEEIRDARQLSYLFISHDLAVVSRIADEVAVMRQGRVVEQAPPCTLFANPKHPYTKALIAAQPEPDIDRPIDLNLVALGAGAPSSWADNFRFEDDNAPPLQELEPGHMVRCHV
ncbi:ABC transporter ATP-binding protein [Amylibacter sp. SFDW26]|uniref:dipeptide ABC transporter ATP-binding protein n=1 Tax=Amylibacter sp. SFDW26 TaxID=2652722 RepID=UPI00126221FD|nr:ABC transporter ATP-binding protein [Amylibacter sp. SFDW26]KAB7615999.1 ABC transporter ATP-binding protein [Amylibacter sp. SFDW26]